MNRSSNSISCIIAVLAVLLLPVVACLAAAGVVGGALTQTSMAWPVRLRDESGAARRSGWYISSPYGWRVRPGGSAYEFHDGIDLASSNGDCPFAARCEVVSMVDGVVSFIGWDDARDPLGSGGGQMVSVVNGNGEFEVTYAHLEPYRLYIRLEGRIDDPYGRYDEWSDYAPIGDGELIPSDVRVSLSCRGPDAPTFIGVEGGATMMFVYDRPAASCTVSVEWPSRGGGWDGWTPDGPTTVSWSTPFRGGRERREALDVGVRFRAVLTPPPPPPPTETPLTPTPGSLEARDAPSVVSAHHADARRVAVGERCRPTTEPCVWRAPLARGGAQARTLVGASSLRAGMGGPLTVGWRTSVRSVEPARDAPMHRPSLQEPPPVVRVRGSVGGAPEAPIGGRLTVTVLASSSTFPLRLSMTPDSSLLLRDVTILRGRCRGGDGAWTCDRDGDSASVIAHLVVDISPHAVGGSMATIDLRADAGGGSDQFAVRIAVLDRQVTPQPWPPPPPTAAAPYPPPSSGGGGGGGGGNPIPPGDTPRGGALACSREPLTFISAALPNGGRGQLAQSAAASFEQVRREVVLQTGVDPLGRIADALRPPEFRTNKPGVARYSWHMTGRAIDVDLGFPWQRTRDGRYWRLFVRQVDVTAIFERQGWSRIPDRADSLEWWHYERRGGLTWAAAMRQVWDVDRLRAAMPEIAWDRIGCAGETVTDGMLEIPRSGERCSPDVPPFDAVVSAAAGCGPPVQIGTTVRQLTDRVGFVGMTGATTGWHLHLSVRASGIQGSVVTHVCSPAWTRGMTPPDDAACWTDTADPLTFLPLASDEDGMVDGQPMQLPPPDELDQFLLRDRPPLGMHWSPNWIDGPFGGGTWGDLIRLWREGER